MRKAVRFFISVILVLIVGLCFLNLKTNALAQTVNPYTTPVNNSDVPQNLHTYSQNVMIETMSALICQLVGFDPIQKDRRCLGIDSINKQIGYVGKEQDNMVGGAIGTVTGLIGYTFQIPISSAHYFSYLASGFGLTKTAFGATDENGTGFESLGPLLPIWAKFRDLVYLLFVLGFIIVGVGIMLRLKIDPRTVMTIQNQIPKVIIGIILVTLTYAIAGLLIDFMWVLINIIINLFASVDPVIQSEIMTTGKYYNAQGQNVITYANSTLSVWSLASDSYGGVKEVIGAAFSTGPGNTFAHIIGAALGFTAGNALLGWIPVVGNLIGSVVGGVLGGVFADEIVSTLAGIIGFLVILVAVLVALFRLWFKLLISYIYILIGVIFSPFWIVAGIIPKSKLGFGSWIKHMLSNLIVFPMTIAMFLIGKVLIDVFDASSGSVFVPPLVGYGGKLGSIGTLIGIGIILATPNVTKYAQEIFKAPKIDMSPIGQSIQAGSAPFVGAGKGAWNRLTRYEDKNRGLSAGPLRNVWGRTQRRIKDTAKNTLGIPDNSELNQPYPPKMGLRIYRGIRNKIADRRTRRGETATTGADASRDSSSL